MARRSRGLTEADRALWRAYATRVTPLPGRALPPDFVPPPAVPAVPEPPPRAPALPLRVQPTRRVEGPLQVGTPPGGLDATRWRDLRRGRLKPERTLDLHGRTAAEAYSVFRNFMAAAQADGVRCVAIVTGKGSTPGGGVLRREFPHWLNAPDLRPILLGAAHPHHANTGAVHLLLRRRRAP